MSAYVQFVVELDVTPGQADPFRALVADLVSATEEEPGTLAYQWNLSADGMRYHVYERYVDAAAAVAHLGMFAQRFAGRFGACVTPARFVVYGAADAALRQTLAGFSPVYLATVAGFHR